jgi:cytochrome c2
MTAFLLHGAAIWIWHAPALYDASVTNELVHTLQHASFLGTALLFWWAVFPLHGARAPRGESIIYLFFTAVHTTLLGALLTFSDVSLYAAYSDALAAPWGLTAITDQELGGLIMWIPGSVVYVAAALLLMLQSLRLAADRADKRDHLRRGMTARKVVGSAAAMVALFMMSACSNRDVRWAAEMTHGTPSRGHDAMRRYGCQSCHSIPGVAGANALVGPPLAGIASRSYIAGVLSNTPDHMIEWLKNPPKVDSMTAMPNMNVTDRDARDIAAYLYTLR